MDTLLRYVEMPRFIPKEPDALHPGFAEKAAR